jgi:hypothetical protein
LACLGIAHTAYSHARTRSTTPHHFLLDPPRELPPEDRRLLEEDEERDEEDELRLEEELLRLDVWLLRYEWL